MGGQFGQACVTLAGPGMPTAMPVDLGNAAIPLEGEKPRGIANLQVGGRRAADPPPSGRRVVDSL